MRILYFIIICLFSTIANGQISKPLYQPTKPKIIGDKNLKPLMTSLSGIPRAERTVLNAFQPTTLPALRRTTISNSSLKIIETSKDGRPIMIQGTLKNSSAGRAISLQVFDYLEAIKQPIQVENPKEEFVLLNQTKDDLGQSHFKMQQQYKGIKVYGGQIWLHAQNNKVQLFNGRNFATPTLKNTNPTITSKAAEAIANEALSKQTKVKKLSEQDKKFMGELKAPELIIYHPINSTATHLAWHLHQYPNLVNQWEYFVDAHTGEILDSYKTLCQLHYRGEDTPSACNHAAKSSNHLSLSKKRLAAPLSTQPQNGPATAVAPDLNNSSRTVHSYEIGGNFFLIDASKPMFNAARSNLPDDPVGGILTIDALNTHPNNDDFKPTHVTTATNDWENQTAVSAHHNAGLAYDYFRNTFSRNSINDGGITILSFINISDEDGSGYDNAFWNGYAMFYGNGKTEFLPLAKSLDVAAHEISHGVIQNTANLQYQGESGAMNESFADVFGVLVDRDDWQLGEDVVNRNIFRTGALRDLQNPHNGGSRLGDAGWQPDNVSEQYRGRQDNGGVHINSGIVNRAFFLIANTIGREKAEQIYYRALTTYLVNTSQFVDLRISLLQAATDRHGANSQEVAVIAAAFDQVGIFGSDTGSGSDSGGEIVEEVEANPGEDFIIYTDDAADNLYLADDQGNILVSPLSQVGILSRPSITDDGANIVYVGKDKLIYLITIDWETGDVFEEVLQDEPIWRNVAVARDGSRVAALTDEITNQIEVFDFTLQAWKIFDLYNPTFTEGVSTGEVQFADVIEFDFTGEFIMYDASNSIKGALGGPTIEYWDIGFVKVFDNTTNDFEQNVNNNISKLFTGLPEEVSIGNPTFSKNSPNIIAFDYIDEATQAVELRGINLATNKQNTILKNGQLNIPSYSRLDDKIIFNAATNQGSNIVAVVPVGKDKISPAGEVALLISQSAGAQKGVWFSDGSRQLTATNDLEKSVADLQIYPNPFSEQLSIQFSLEKRKDLSLTIYNTLGKQLLSYKITGLKGKNQQIVDTTPFPKGTYFVTLQSVDGIVSKKVVK